MLLIMKPKTCEEGPTALRNFTRTMQALFRVPKAEVIEPKQEPSRAHKKRRLGRKQNTP